MVNTVTAAKLKIVTIVGTRPEIIRLASTIKSLDNFTNHVLVHTGQNYDYELNEIFLKILGFGPPIFFSELTRARLALYLS